MQLEIVLGNITAMKVDAIVNAANSSLLGGGGVDRAIHRAAGTALLRECRRLGGCNTGEAKLTKGYRLPAPYVIHAVGPVWQGGGEGEADLLRSCYQNALRIATNAQLKSIAFPAISTGVYHYPLSEAARIAIESTIDFLDQAPGCSLESIYFVCFNKVTYTAYSNIIAAKTPLESISIIG